MNAEDALVAPAVGAVLDEVATLVDQIVNAIRAGGRLFYIFDEGLIGITVVERHCHQDVAVPFWHYARRDFAQRLLGIDDRVCRFIIDPYA